MVGLTQKERNLLYKSDRLIYFIVVYGVSKHAQSSICTLYQFYKTLSGYLEKQNLDQDAYFEFKDRYRKALNKDRFISEEYVQMWERWEQFYGLSCPWKEWTEIFLETKDRDLSNLHLNHFEDLERYLSGYAVLGNLFGVLAGWEEKSFPLLREVVWLMKLQSLLLSVYEDSRYKCRYLPLMNSGLVSISQIEVIRKPESYQKLIMHYVKIFTTRLNQIESRVANVSKKNRPILRCVLFYLRETNKRISRNPEDLFSKESSFFKVSLRSLILHKRWYSFKGLFIK